MKGMGDGIAILLCIGMVYCCDRAIALASAWHTAVTRDLLLRSEPGDAPPTLALVDPVLGLWDAEFLTPLSTPRVDLAPVDARALTTPLMDITSTSRESD